MNEKIFVSGNVRVSGDARVSGLPAFGEVSETSSTLSNNDELLEILRLCRMHMYEHASNTPDNAFEKLCAYIAKMEGGAA